MHIVTDPIEARRLVMRWACDGKRVGVVPTMGALHAGHLSLVERAKTRCDRVAATIFVNPTQFGPNEDFDRYPRTLDADLKLLAQQGTDLVLTPETEVMFPKDATTAVAPPRVASTLEGTFRPGHFAGVATVVLKLLNILPGSDAFFGEKDYQQLLVIRHMARDLDLGVEIHGCPIVREGDGLAMSSRNRYLDPGQRQTAREIYRTLQATKQAIAEGETDWEKLERASADRLLTAGFDRVDYVAIRDAASLCSVDSAQGPVVILVAAHLGKTRLIDNLRAEPPLSVRREKSAKNATRHPA